MGWERDYEHEAAMKAAALSVTEGEWKGDAPKAYRMGALHALISRDDVSTNGVPDLRWHISLSRQDRIPTWTELSKCADALRPGVVFCVPMPPKSMWLNIHENTLHLHEIKDEPLVEQWRAEGRMTRSFQTAGRDYR
jgi:hypothetical protein